MKTMYNEYPERIYVDRGIDASTAALLNKDGMSNDLWPMMAMMNGGMGGFGGGGWWIWILIMFMFGGWGGNGAWGRNAQGGCCPCTTEQLSTIQETIQDNHNNDLVMAAVKGNNDAISQLATKLNCDFNTVNSGICAIQGAIDKVGGQVNFSSERVINAVNSGNCNIIQALKDCCCETQKEILVQSNALQRGQDFINRSIERGFADTAYATQQQTCALQEAIKDSTAQILAGQRAAEMREMQNKIDQLRDERTALQLQASQSAQTASIVNQVRPCPIPAYLTCNPYGCNSGLNYGYGYGYNYGGCADGILNY